MCGASESSAVAVATLALVVGLAGGCTRRAAPGEPCVRTDDCRGALRCVGQICADAAALEARRRRQAAETTAGLEQITAGARQYYLADHYDVARGDLLPRRFPRGRIDWTPATPCCQQPGGTCAHDRQDWADATWRELRFQPRDPSRFQWRYTSRGEGREATFTIEARGDLDCDGRFSSYTVVGSVNLDWEVEVKGPLIRDGLE